MVYKRWPHPKGAGSPENIQWQNITYGRFNLMIRRWIIYLIALVVTLAAFIGIVYFKDLEQAQADKFSGGTDVCPVDITKEQAYVDFSHIRSLQKGYMGCYCMQ